MVPREIIDAVIDYIENHTNPFALLLRGPWGSGKTKLIEAELTAALEKLAEPYRLIRVSMIGVQSSEDIYSRIIKGALNEYAGMEEGSAEKKGKALRKTATEMGLSYLGATAKKVFKEIGVNYSPAADTMSSLLLPNKCLLVMDDLERIGSIDELELFGVVADLMESRGQKILLVCANEGKSPSNDILERLVWRSLDLTQDYDSIVETLFDGIRGTNLSFPAKTAIATGVRNARIANIRCMMRSIPAVEKLLESNYFRNEAYSELSRRETFIDAVEHIMLLLDGNLPPRPARLGEQSDVAEQLDYDRKEENWQRSNALSILDSLIDSISDFDNDALSQKLEAYGKTYHPSSDIEQNAISKAAEVPYATLTDDDAERAASSIAAALESGLAAINNLPKLLNSLSLLKEWGFVTDSQWKMALDGSCGIVKADPASAARGLNQFNIGYERIANELEGLHKIAQDELTRQRAKQLQACLEADGDKAACLAKILSGFSSDYSPLLQLNPSDVASIMHAGSPSGIFEFRSEILHLEKSMRLQEANAEIGEWLAALEASLDQESATSKMSRVQIGYLKENLISTIQHLKTI